MKFTELDRNQIHVWHSVLNFSECETERFHASLSRDEKQRADKFHFEKDRIHFVNGRGLLRQLLGLYLHVPPAGLCFSYSPFGKPGIVSDPGVHFNVSHSGGNILIAISRQHPVGVDIEERRANMDVLEIAQSFFSADERNFLLSAQATQRTELFFQIWTRKEAYLKAFGSGLSVPLDRYSVLPCHCSPVQLVTEQAETWTLYDLPAPQGFAAALAVANDGHTIKYREWGQPSPPA